MLTRALGADDARIAGQVAVFEHHHLDVIAVGADELAAPIVEGHAVLRAAALGAQLERARVEGKIAAAQRHAA